MDSEFSFINFIKFSLLNHIAVENAPITENYKKGLTIEQEAVEYLKK